MAKIRGTRELKAAIRRAGPDIQEEAVKEVRASTQRMHRAVMALMNSAASYAPFWHGKPGMQNISGDARSAYRYSVSKANMQGRVGLLSAAAERKAFYLRYFFYGTSHQPSRNVHDDAFEGERDTFIENQGRALERVLGRMG